MTNIFVNWTPPIAGDYFIEIYAVPVVEENPTYNNVLNTTMIITAESDIWIDPSGFNIMIDQGEVREENLTIGNDGLADLILDPILLWELSALSFDGDDDYIDVGSVSTGSNTFSVSLWIKTDRSSQWIMDYVEVFGSKSNSGNNDWTDLCINSAGKIVFRFMPGNDDVVTITSCRPISKNKS